MIPLANAAGQVKLPHEVEPLLALPSDILSSVTLGSYTLEQRAGNAGNVFWDTPGAHPTSINALGLPNPGVDEARKFMPGLLRRIHASGKKARVSVAGFGVEEYRELMRFGVGMRADEIEVNLGCPNIRVDGAQKPIFAFNPDDLDAILMIAHRESGSLGEPGVAIKLSPYSDPFFLAEIGNVLRTRLLGDEKLVICNTFPNAYAFSERQIKPVIDANDGYGGLAGGAMKHIALGQVRQFRKLLPMTKISGVGGIASGRDLREMELAGATEAQVGTAFFLGGPRVFQRIAEEYVSQFEDS